MNRIKAVQQALAGRLKPVYLEIGVSRGDAFRRITADEKIAVDPAFKLSARSRRRLAGAKARATHYFETTSDAFFANETAFLEQRGIDVALIDGLHTYGQVIREYIPGGSVCAYGAVVDAHTVGFTHALEETRTGDVWLFRGHSGPDRAIQTMSNSPVNHVGMTVAIEDLPPLMWHAELGEKLTDVWTATNHRGVQLNDAREAVERWLTRYGQRCWLRQISPDIDHEQENQLLRVIARMDGTPFPSTTRLTLRWLRGQLPTRYDWVCGIPILDSHVRESTRRRREQQRKGRFESAYCAETVAVTYEEMGLIETEKRSIGLTLAGFGAVTIFR